MKDKAIGSPETLNDSLKLELGDEKLRVETQKGLPEEPAGSSQVSEPQAAGPQAQASSEPETQTMPETLATPDDFADVNPFQPEGHGDSFIDPATGLPIGFDALDFDFQSELERTIQKDNMADDFNSLSKDIFYGSGFDKVGSELNHEGSTQSDPFMNFDAGMESMPGFAPAGFGNEGFGSDPRFAPDPKFVPLGFGIADEGFEFIRQGVDRSGTGPHGDFMKMFQANENVFDRGVDSHLPFDTDLSPEFHAKGLSGFHPVDTDLSPEFHARGLSGFHPVDTDFGPEFHAKGLSGFHPGFSPLSRISLYDLSDSHLESTNYDGNEFKNFEDHPNNYFLPHQLGSEHEPTSKGFYAYNFYFAPIGSEYYDESYSNLLPEEEYDEEYVPPPEESSEDSSDTNAAPTDMTLSNSSVAEDVDTSSAYTIGSLSTTDADSGDTHTYSIVGGADAANFQVSGSSLQFKAGTSLDFETKTSYAVTVRTTDSSAATYDETLTVSITDVDEIAPTVSLEAPGTSLNFAGDSTANYAYASSYSMPTSAITLEMWVKMDGEFDTNQGSPFSYEVDGKGNDFLVFQRGRQVFVNGTSYQVGLDAADDLWHHLAVTWDSTTGELKAYDNGVLISTYSNVSTDTALTSGGTLLLGQEQDGELSGFSTGQAYEGSIRDVRVWSDVRTQTEIQANRYTTLTGNESGLAGAWLLNEGSGASATDLTGSQNLTIEGTTWVTGETSNDRPTIFTEDGSAVDVVDGHELFEVADSTNTNLTGATITLTNLPDSSSESLSIDTTGTSITAGSYNSSTGVLTLSGTDTLLNYQNVLATLQYDNTAATPDTATRSITITVTDGTNTSDTFTENVYIKPTINTGGVSLDAVNEDSTLNISTVQVTHDDATNVQVFLKVDNGTLNMTTATGLTFVDSSSNNSGWMSFHGTLSDVNTALASLQYTPDANYNGTDTLETHVLGFQNSSVNTIGNIHYNSTTEHFYELINGARTWGQADTYAGNLDLDGMQGYLTTLTTSSEDSFVADLYGDILAWMGGSDAASESNWRWITGPEGEANDGAGTAFSYTNWNAGEPDDNDNALDQDYAYFVGKSDDWGDLPGKTTYLTQGMLVEYGGLSTDSLTENTTITINAVNDAPTISNLSGDTPSFTEDAGAVEIDEGENATIADVDDTNLESATVTITNLQDGASESLSATTTGTNITASYDSGTGVLTLSGTDTIANYQTVLRSVTYNNTSDLPDETNRIIRTVLSDGTNTSSNYDVTMSVAVANDAPVIANLDGDGITYIEGFGASPLDPEGDASVSDTDDADYNDGYLEITNIGGKIEDVLSIAETGGITVSGDTVMYDSGDGSDDVIGSIDGTADGADGNSFKINFTTTDATDEAVGALIQAIRFHNTGDDPGSSRTMRFNLNDGTGSSVNNDVTVAVNASNDAPVLTSVSSNLIGLDGTTTDYLIKSGVTGFPTNKFTIEMWVQPHNVSGDDGTPLSYSDGTQHNEIIIFNNAETFFIKGSSYSTGLTLTDDQWQHIAFSWDSTANSNQGELKVYLNGSLTNTIATDAVGGQSIDGGGTLVLGQEQDSEGGGFQDGQAFTGNLGETRIWDDIRTGDEISDNLHTTLVPGDEANLVSYYELTEGSSGSLTASDSTSNDNDLTVNRDNLTNVGWPNWGALYQIEGGPIPLFDSNDLRITDPDDTNIESATITITNDLDGSDESLHATTTGTNISAFYSIGTLTLSGSDTLANYMNVIQDTTYSNGDLTPNTTTRELEIKINDGTDDSNTVTGSIYYLVFGDSDANTINITGFDSGIVIDGREDTDLLKIDSSGITIDTNHMDTITNIERFDIDGGGNNTLNLTVNDVLDMSSTTDDLYVDGSSGDVVNLEGSGWSQDQTGVSAFSNTYDSYINSAGTAEVVYVDQDLTVNLNT